MQKSFPMQLSGVINSNLTFSNETISLTSNVEIKGTLTIGENVIIEGNGYTLESFGEIKIEGNSLNSPTNQVIKNTHIRYNSSSSSENNKFTIDSYNLTNVSIQRASGGSGYGHFSLTNSIINQPQDYTYIWYPKSDILISGNTFNLKDSNWGLSIGHSTTNVTIQDNTFKEHNGSRPLIENWASYNNTKTTVKNNTFIDPSTTIFSTPSGYSNNVSDAIYVNNLYKNVLGRSADTSGLNYWLSQLNSGAETRYEVLLGFSESAENKALFTEMTGFV